MATNNRVFWAVKAASVAKRGETSYTPIHGLQSIGITTTFNLEQVFEIGQIEIYENIEDIPDIEVTMEKVIDGYPLIYHLATAGSASATLAGRQNQRPQVALEIFNDTNDSASGIPLSRVTMSGMYVSSLTYTIPVEGSCTESLTLIGNHKTWENTTLSNAPAATVMSSTFDNTDEPLALTSGLGGVQRRENVVFAGATLADVTRLPAGSANINGIPGISSSGTNDKTNDVYGAHIQGITISVDLGREALNELGRRTPFYRFITFPTEVTCDIEVLVTDDGDNIQATEDGVISGSNLVNETIQVVLEDGTVLYLGTRNKLSNVTYGGGDAGGGNDTATYSYLTYNTLTVTHPQDPSGL